MMSFRLYGFPWAIPIGIFFMGLLYAFLFWAAAVLSSVAEKRFHLPPIWIKVLFLLVASTIRPFGFDWFKPELMFVESYLGVEKWRFALILFAILLTILKQRLFYLILIIFAYEPIVTAQKKPDAFMTTKLVTTYIPIEKKWDPKMLSMQVDLLFQKIDEAIQKKKKHIIFPESILPLFLNKEQILLEELREKSHAIAIVMGALKWDESVPRNSTYIFQKGKMIIADKVILVPFGESNPLPDWLGHWVNKIFYDGAVDYKASAAISDYKLGEETYGNAICYEACSEELYIGKPKRMIVLSNNGWFIPSIEPTQQRLLLQYYSRKYGTTIYHSINMSPSYIIQRGQVIWKDDY